MKKLRIGVLGVSNHLIKRVILPLNKTEHCYISAIASRNIDKAKSCAKKFGIEKAFGNYQDIIDSDEIDLVYIPLPNHIHSDWVEKAALAGKHIICEKPIALSSTEAKKCINICEKQGVFLMEAFMYKFHPQWQYAKEIIATNQIGKINYINTLFSYNNPSSINIRNVKNYGGGGLMDIGCYAISVPRYLLDKEPLRAISLKEIHTTFETDILTSAILDFNGIHASFNVSTLSHATQSVEIVSAAGRIRIEIPFNAYVDVKSSISIYTAQGERKVSFNVCDQYGLMFDGFAESVLNNKPIPVPAMDSYYNMKVIDAINKSAQTQHWENI